MRSDTLLLVDPTEIRKEFSHKMEFVTRVRDASRSSKEGRDVLVNGYHGRMVAACRCGGRKTVPLALRLWSSRSPGFKGESDEVLKVVKEVYAATGGKGIAVYDRGGDRPAFHDCFIGENRDFIVRLKGRSVLSWGGMHEVHDLARQCTMRHSHHVTFDSHGKECNVPISFGAMPVRLPMHPEKELRLVVVRGFGQDPMMLLTSLPVDGSFKSQWRVVEGCLSRWRIEETIRFVKQSYGFENIRVMTCARIRDMASLVLASAYLATAWTGRNIKREVLAEHLGEPREAARRSAGVRGLRHCGRDKAGVHPFREMGAHGSRDPCQGSRTCCNPAPAGLCGTPRHRRRIAVSDAKRLKPHHKTHFSLYPCGCNAFPHSKNG